MGTTESRREREKERWRSRETARESQIDCCFGNRSCISYLPNLRHHVVQRVGLRANRHLLKYAQLDRHGPWQPWLWPRLYGLGGLLQVGSILLTVFLGRWITTCWPPTWLRMSWWLTEFNSTPLRWCWWHLNFDLTEMMTQVVEIEGYRIGLIGYITDLTPSITSGDLPNLSFQDVSKAVQYYNMNPISYIFTA